MSDSNSLIPISDEQAKLGQEAIKALSGIGKFFAGTLRRGPADFFGKAIGDKIAIDRWEAWQRRYHAAQKRLAADGIEPVEPSSQYAGPLLLAAEEEDRSEFNELWDALLAASMNPAKRGKLRLKFIETVKRLDPLDVAVFFASVSIAGQLSGESQNEIIRRIAISQDELAVSVENLIEVGLAMRINPGTVTMGPFGREFLRAVTR